MNSLILDNPIWHALSGNQANLSTGDDLAKFYPRDMLPMAGMKNTEKESFEALAKLCEPGKKFGICLLHDVKLPELNKWKIHLQFDTAQMVRDKKAADTVSDITDIEIVRLEALDVPHMKELAQLTQPGPFTDRTIEFGPFYGIKSGDKLVAMAGQRMRPGTYTEISGVCTHPDFQGKGYARALVNKASDKIAELGEIPFLHVMASNIAAIKSYTACGFTQRCLMQYLIIEKI